MTANELLTKIIKLRKAIDYRKAKIASLVARAENTSANLTGMPHNPVKDPSPMATAIGRKVDLEAEVNMLTEERNTLIAQIDLVEDDDLARLLNLRYAQEINWDEIMAEMNYSHSWLFQLHRKAKEKLDKVLKDRTKKQ